MIEKIKKMFQEKDEKKKSENLIAFLIILVVTLIFMNKILTSEDSDENIVQNQVGVELVANDNQEAALVDNENDLSKNLENILSKINGVR